LQSTGRGSFAGADFAPVHEGDHAGVLFYPRGSSTPTSGPTAVIDVDQAARIIAAAGAGDPLPAGDQTVPTLNGWTPVPGQAPARGSLGAVPGQQLTYFGLPYPPPVTSASAQSSFYGSCLPPDPALETLQVHSPVNLVLTGSGGERFGTDAGGHAIHTAPGLGLTTGDETTYAVPAGSYRVSIAGTGSGQAHLVVLTAGKAAERATTFAFEARRAQSGELRITSGGPSSTLTFGGRRVRATTGLPLAARGLTAGLDHRHRRTLKVTVTSLGEAIDGAVISARGDGTGATAITDRRGRATLALRPAKPGAVRVTVTAASAAPLRRTLHVR
jgi:hypothetical protein